MVIRGPKRKGGMGFVAVGPLSGPVRASLESLICPAHKPGADCGRTAPNGHAEIWQAVGRRFDFGFDHPRENPAYR